MLDDAVLREVGSVFPELRDGAPAVHRSLREQASDHRIAAGTAVFDEGSPCRAFLLILEGSLRVAKTSQQGREILLYTLSRGETCVMTLACLLGERPYPARGVVVEMLRAVSLPRPLFEHLLAEVPDFRRRLFASFGERLIDLTGLVEDVAFRRLDQRLAAHLLRRVEAGGDPVIPATHQELADELGSVREIVSRILGSFESGGLVRLDRGRVTVLSREGLAALASGT